MRDVLLHGYRTVDLAEVYRAATVSIPDLIPRFERILSSINEEAEEQ
jgi:uncharacterized protein with HEPN domain